MRIIACASCRPMCGLLRIELRLRALRALAFDLIYENTLIAGPPAKRYAM